MFSFGMNNLNLDPEETKSTYYRFTMRMLYVHGCNRDSQPPGVGLPFSMMVGTETPCWHSRMHPRYVPGKHPWWNGHLASRQQPYPNTDQPHSLDRGFHLRLLSNHQLVKLHGPVLVISLMSQHCRQALLDQLFRDITVNHHISKVTTLNSYHAQLTC